MGAGLSPSGGTILVLGTGERPFDAMFAPRTVALIGATEKPGSVGCRVSRC
jgi:hypothetical protein